MGSSAKGFWQRLADVIGEMVLEAVATAMAIGIIAGAHYLIELWIGEGKKFFDYIPVAWVFDAGHIAIVLRLVWRVFRKFNND